MSAAAVLAHQRAWFLTQGDVLAGLAELPDASVNCCITSPPYWSLRSYLPTGHPDKVLEMGSEPTSDAYVARLVAVFREVRRVLRRDGTCWVNLGDSYVSTPSGSTGDTNGFRNGRAYTGRDGVASTGNRGIKPVGGLKPKDLCGIPWMVALALRADGWWLRSAITLCKRAPMPESVTDRPTSATEMLFLLARSSRYWYDQEAVREEAVSADDPRNRLDYEPKRERNVGGRQDGYTAASGAMTWPAGGRNLRNWWLLSPEPFSGAALGGTSRITSPDCPVHGHRAGPVVVRSGGEQPGASDPDRNRRSGDRPDPTPEAAGVAIPEGQSSFLSGESSATPHSTVGRRTAAESGPGATGDGTPASRTGYTVPSDHSVGAVDRTLGSSNAADAALGESGFGPAARIGDRTSDNGTAEADASSATRLGDEPRTASSSTSADCAPGASGLSVRTTTSSTGTSSGDQCSCRIVPQDHYAVFPTEIPRRAILAGCPPGGVVLDPFAGSGTTLLVALRLGRRALGIELSPAYVELATRRIVGDAPLFNTPDLGTPEAAG